MHSSGAQAEERAAQYLQSQGFEIMARNWRRPYAEIDIVAQKSRQLYFVEVKYRKSNQSGSAIEFITTQKLRQMERAAQWWLIENSYDDAEICLSAITLEGRDYLVTEFLEEL